MNNKSKPIPSITANILFDFFKRFFNVASFCLQSSSCDL